MAIEPKPYTPEMLIPRIGVHLVEQGLISEKDLNEALRHQKETPAGETPKLIGQILIDLNKIDRQTLDRAVTEQILQLREALEESNQRLEKRVYERTKQLEQAIKKLNELSELKANFISNISHELRTPLTHIKGYLELLVSGDLGEMPVDQLDVLKIMHRASGKLERLIEDLIMFTFADQEEVLITQTEFDLVAATFEVIQHYKNITPHRQINFSVEPPAVSVNVFADQTKISWVIDQLIENALKFSNPDTPVSVVIHPSIEKATISIKDQGIGIARERIPEVFEPFHQLDGSSTRRFGGVGLGLTLAKKILDAHHQELTITSIPNEGSRFDFSVKRLIK